MWIEEKMKGIWRQISSSEKAAFFTTIVGGMIAHLYIYTNTIPNFDGISRVYDEQQMTISGRWFLHYVSKLNYCTQMPMVIGVLAMLFLALSVMLTVRMLSVTSWLLASLWGLLFAVFPAVADTNAYTFTASAYCTAIFLATAGVWIAEKKKWGFGVGVLFLALSMGIYQTYVTVAIILSVFLVLADIWKEEKSAWEVLKKGIRSLAFLALGTLLYYIILKIFLYAKDLTLISYLGMSEVESGYPIAKIGSILLNTYAQVGTFFFLGDDGLVSRIFLLGNLFLAILTLVLLVRAIRERKLWRNPVKLAGLILLLAVIPVSVNFVQVISPYSEPRLLMKLAYSYLYLLPVVFLEIVQGCAKKSSFPHWKEAAAVCTAGCLLLLSVYFWEYDNLLYTMLNQSHRATLSFVTNVVSRIESCEGYEMGMEVVIVGGFPSDRYDTSIAIYDLVEHESAFSSSVIPLNKHIYYYMNDWLNVLIEEPSEETFYEVVQTEEFQEMPLYPDDGSVKIIDNRVVVKMQETYTPKSSYEIEYEQRR